MIWYFKYCRNCFYNRDEILIKYLLNEWGFDSIFYSPHMIGLYQTLFKDTSHVDNSILYNNNYKTYNTYEEFIIYANDIHYNIMNSEED